MIGDRQYSEVNIMLDQQLLTIRLVDGSLVTRTPEQIAQYEEDWRVILAHTSEQGARRLLGCLAHDDDVKCEVCGGDE